MSRSLQNDPGPPLWLSYLITIALIAMIILGPTILSLL